MMMTGQDERKNEILQTYLEDLLSDRRPKLPEDAMAVFDQAELEASLVTMRMIKAALQPSRHDETSSGRLLEELRARVRTQASQTADKEHLARLLTHARKQRGLEYGEIARGVKGLRVQQLKGLERGQLDPLSLAASVYADLQRLLWIAPSDLARALAEAGRWWTNQTAQRLRMERARAVPAGLDSGPDSGAAEENVRALEAERRDRLAACLRAVLVSGVGEG